MRLCCSANELCLLQKLHIHIQCGECKIWVGVHSRTREVLILQMVVK